MKWFFVSIIFIAFIAGFIFSLWIKNQEVIPVTLKIGQTTLNIEVVNTDATRERGLSGKIGLGENEGMLFIFEKEGNYGFWMKDMNFPIDIAWLDKNKKIIHMEKNVAPETYPKTFNSPTPSLYVLETSANFFESHNINIGDVSEF